LLAIPLPPSNTRRPSRLVNRPPASSAGHVDDAEHDLVALFERDEIGVQGNTADEGLRAVDGVDDPRVAGVARVVGKFLADETVVREVRRHGVAHGLLDLPIGLGNRGAVPLGLDREGGVLEVVLGQGAGAFGQVESEADAVRAVVAHDFEYATRPFLVPPVACYAHVTLLLGG
jgi:hypothetical protein